jgi:hypothetical protein
MQPKICIDAVCKENAKHSPSYFVKHIVGEGGGNAFGGDEPTRRGKKATGLHDHRMLM